MRVVDTEIATIDSIAFLANLFHPYKALSNSEAINRICKSKFHLELKESKAENLGKILQAAQVRVLTVIKLLDYKH